MSNKINMFKARSTWVALFTVVAAALSLAGVIGPNGSEAFITGMSEHAMAIVAAVGATWVYLERTVFNQSNNLTVRATTRSPAWVSAAALVTAGVMVTGCSTGPKGMGMGALDVSSLKERYANAATAELGVHFVKGQFGDLVALDKDAVAAATPLCQAAARMAVTAGLGLDLSSWCGLVQYLGPDDLRSEEVWSAVVREEPAPQPSTEATTDADTATE